jgi:hypothetical protein
MWSSKELCVILPNVAYLSVTSQQRSINLLYMKKSVSSSSSSLHY